MNNKERLVIKVGGPKGGVGKTSSVSLLEEFYSHYESEKAKGKQKGRKHSEIAP